MIIVERYDISKMKEDTTYSKCPYCGKKEQELPPPIEMEVNDVKSLVECYVNVNGKQYPFEANGQSLNDAYAHCHYGVSYWWTEIRCCTKCKKEYYTVHEH